MSTQESLSIIVPTYKECANLRPLTERIFKALKAEQPSLDAEVVVVDDNSNDGSEELVAQLQKEGHNVRILVRRKERGLSSAVVHGFVNAKNPVLVCMDADLQHDPIYLPSLVKPMMTGKADFVVGSRNVGGGKVEEWSFIRKLISFVATIMAAPLTTCTDPMSGFFCLHKNTFVNGHKNLNPMGYKIGLELMVKCECKRIVDIPIVFKDREEGESKLTMKQNLLYLRQLLGLYWMKYPIPMMLGVVLALAFVYFLLTSLF